MKTPLKRVLEAAKALLDESALRSQVRLSKLEKFAHFWIMVWRSFSRNRCPVRASALAYATLLALIPMLAVVVSVTSTFLKKEGEDRIDQFIVKVVGSVTGSGTVVTNGAGATTHLAAVENGGGAAAVAPGTNAPAAPAEGARLTEGDAGQKDAATAASTNEVLTEKARGDMARTIHEFIQNTQSGALGVTGSVLLIFAAISMLSRVEDTFNDIWGVARGRNWFTRIVVYWGVITLAPLLLVVAAGLASGPHLEGTRKFLTTMPFSGYLVFQFLPVVVLCLTFALFYVLMPNTKVSWRAALVGGLAGGTLFHLNNAMSVLYVSRVVSNSRIYGSLGLVPVFMIGLYLSWLILLFGAQVAYAFQNRATYMEEKQVENINQRGREFIALRLMTCIGQCFVRGEPPPNSLQIAQALSVPTRLVRQVMRTLAAARLVAETAGAEPAFLPARPMSNITCHDILLAMRANHGQELGTRDEPARSEVYGEFHRIEEAERAVASGVTMLDLVNRSQAKQIAE